MSKGKILSIGSYNIGFTVSTKEMPIWGETIVGKNFFESHGGKGSNQAVAAQRLGGDVSFIGKFGDDNAGHNGIKMLKNEGVNVKSVMTSDTNTGVGVIILNKENDNAIILDLGANMELTVENIEERRNVIREADTVIFQMEIPFEAIKKGMEIANEYGKRIIFNPAPANGSAAELLSLATFVNPNESELLILNGMDPSAKISKEKTIELAKKVLNKGPEVVIVTRGEKGSIIVTEHSEEFIEPTIVNEVKDTTGAGDTFTGALAYALTEGRDLIEAVRFANIAGAYSVTRKGVIPALPTLAELEKFMSKKVFMEEGENNEKNYYRY